VAENLSAGNNGNDEEKTENFEERTGQFVKTFVVACAGDAPSQRQVTQLIGQLMRDPATVPLANSLMQIVAGERDRVQLLSGLGGEPARLVAGILDRLSD
jgi:hypothetical protein